MRHECHNSHWWQHCSHFLFFWFIQEEITDPIPNLCADDMSKGSLSTGRSDLNKRAFNYMKDQHRSSTQRSSHRHRSFSILTWIRRTSRRVVQAMKDFVKCLTSDTDADSSCYQDDDMTSTSISLETPPVLRQRSQDQRSLTAKKTRYKPPRRTCSSRSRFRAAPGFVEEPDSKQRAKLSRLNKSRNAHTVVEERRRVCMPSINFTVFLIHAYLLHLHS